MKILCLATHYHPVDSETKSRVDIARESLQRLSGEVLVFNLQYNDESYAYENIKQVNCLRITPQALTGRSGKRKPIIKEMLDNCHALAKLENAPFFGLINNDIIIGSKIERLLHDSYESYVFSRYDIDSITKNSGTFYFYGFDLFIISTGWYEKNKWRFRRYIIGEPMWDSAYVGILKCHSNCRIFNYGDPYIYHIRHVSQWLESPYSSYVTKLSCLDGIYQEMYRRYWRWRRDKQENITESENRDAIERFFSWPPNYKARLKQIARSIKAELRYMLQKRNIIPDSTYPK